MTGLSDSFQRPINYLRVSVTDRCNLRCRYCMPSEGITLMPRNEILSYEEIHTIAQVAVELGITAIRLTGGEPLVRSGLAELMAMLAQIENAEDISMTTNGVLLQRHAAELKGAGLRRVNISLDTLKRDRYQYITQRDELNHVLDGIEAAEAAGLYPVKINVVVMRGINDDEILDFAVKSRDEGWNVRFIELMPFGKAAALEFMPVSEMKQRLLSLGRLEPCLPSTGKGPARYYRMHGASGTIGFISPVSEHFCFGCNRLRLTVDGKLHPCLLAEEEVDLRKPLREGASPREVERLIREAVASKPERHCLSQGFSSKKRAMAQIGG